MKNSIKVSKFALIWKKQSNMIFYYLNSNFENLIKRTTNSKKVAIGKLEMETHMIDDSIKNSKPNREGFIDVMRLTNIVWACYV